MFRAPSKKKKKTVTRLRSDSDEEEETTTATEKDVKPSRPKTKKSKKRKGLLVRSFDVGEGDDEAETLQTIEKKTKRSRKRKSGLGFGGADVVVHDEDELENDPTTETGTGESSTNVYGREALAKLKQEQAYKKPVVDEDTVNEQTTRETNPKNVNVPPARDDGDYIPLNGKEPNMILTGDEALDFVNKKSLDAQQAAEKKREHFKTVLDDSNLFNDAVDHQQAEESSAWEAQITRRAGIVENKQSTGGQDANRNDRLHASTSSNTAMSLAKLRSQIQSTIVQLETQDNDVDRAHERRTVELGQTSAELERQEKELSESGEALESYQRLREQLSFWTGAVRDLKSKVQPIQDALIDLEADIVKCPLWRDWEDDMCAVLHQAGLLDRVLGRQPPDFVFEDTTTYVDEFGRDVKSQYAMNREKRTRRRLDIQRMGGKPVEEDDSDVGIGEDDIDTFQQRRAALAKALEIALKELEDEYTQLPQLALIFHEWQKSHPEDFKQCFASLSFGDLASVLVQVEVCKCRTNDNTSQDWIGEASTGEKGAIFPWMSKLSALGGKCNGGPTTKPADELIDRVIEKSYIPLLSAVLEKGAYSILSKTQSRAFSAFFCGISKWNSKRSSPHFETMRSQLFDYLKTSLGCVAMAILNDKASQFDIKTDNKKLSNQELLIAMHGATEGQLRRATKMLVNVVTYWSPFLSAQSGNDVIDYVLDLISSKYLFLLSSLRTRSDKTVDLFSRVWEALRETNWLDQPGRMLQAAPIRAAATAFNLT